MKNTKIAFIGCGNMATAMISGILKKRVITPSNIFVSDNDKSKLTTFSKLGVHTSTNNQEGVDFANYVFLTIKPQQYSQALQALDNTKDKVFVTVAPGISIDCIVKHVGHGKVVRTMPNTPALIGKGVTAICYSNKITDQEKTVMTKLLNSFGTSYEIKESQMDGIIPLTGSSPALVYSLIDTMAEFGKQLGIDKALAIKMVSETFAGATLMVLQSDESPQTLCDRVCSKGGTTQEMLSSLDAGNFKEIIVKSMTACINRAKELSVKHQP